MVKVSYECDTTGQRMTVEYRDGPEPGTMAMQVRFDPKLKDEIVDPYGVLGSLHAALIRKDHG